jgi:hypothetical protein
VKAPFPAKELSTDIFLVAGSENEGAQDEHGPKSVLYRPALGIG